MGGTRENTDRYIGQTVYKSVCVGTRENKQVGRSDSMSWIKKKILAATLEVFSFNFTGTGTGSSILSGIFVKKSLLHIAI